MCNSQAIIYTHTTIICVWVFISSCIIDVQRSSGTANQAQEISNFCKVWGRFAFFLNQWGSFSLRTNKECAICKMKMYIHFRYSRVHQEIKFLGCRKEVPGFWCEAYCFRPSDRWVHKLEKDFGIISCAFSIVISVTPIWPARTLYECWEMTAYFIGSEEILHRLSWFKFSLLYVSSSRW